MGRNSHGHQSTRTQLLHRDRTAFDERFAATRSTDAFPAHRPHISFAAGGCPTAHATERTALDAQHVLQKILASKRDESDVELSHQQRDTIRAYKQALVGTIDVQLA